jgi:hypothetical protein
MGDTETLHQKLMIIADKFLGVPSQFAFVRFGGK